MRNTVLDTMVNFKKPFSLSFFFSTDREKTIYCDEKPLGLFTTVEASSSVEADVLYYNLLFAKRYDMYLKEYHALSFCSLDILNSQLYTLYGDSSGHLDCFQQLDAHGIATS